MAALRARSTPSAALAATIRIANAEESTEQQPLTLAVAFLATALVVWLFGMTQIGQFLLQATVGMMFHELGHATAGWLSGAIAIPLPFRTVYLVERSLLAFLVTTAVCSFAIWRGICLRLWFWTAIGLVGLLLMLGKGVANDDQSRTVWAACSGVGGEFVLGTLCALAYFHTAYRSPSWDLMRYPIMALGLSGLLQAWTRWRRIAANDVPFPIGSIFGGDGDMGHLLAAGLDQNDITASYLTLGSWCLAVLLAYTAWHLWLGLRQRQSPGR